MQDSYYFSKMVGRKESQANYFGLFDLAKMWEEMVVVTNYGKVVDFATSHYIVKHYTEEAENKMDHLAYLMVVATIVGAD